MLKLEDTRRPGSNDPPPVARIFVNAASLFFSVIQLAYGGVLLREASRRTAEPGWIGLGMMGLAFALAAILFMSAAVGGLRAGTWMQRSRLMLPATLLMLAGSAGLVLGTVLRN